MPDLIGADLNLKERRFVMEYIKLGNGTQAAINAGMSPRSAHVTAARLLTRANIQAAIKEMQLAEQAESLVTLTATVRELARVGLSDIKNVASWDHETGLTFFPSEELSEDASRSIASIKSKRKRLIDGHGDDAREWIVEEMEVKLWPKTAALDSLMKHLGGYEKDNQQSAPGFIDQRTQVLMPILGTLTAEEKWKIAETLLEGEKDE